VTRDVTRPVPICSPILRTAERVAPPARATRLVRVAPVVVVRALAASPASFVWVTQVPARAATAARIPIAPQARTSQANLKCATWGTALIFAVTTSAALEVGSVARTASAELLAGPSAAVPAKRCWSTAMSPTFNTAPSSPMARPAAERALERTVFAPPGARSGRTPRATRSLRGRRA
jgi:hypothetical protein